MKTNPLTKIRGKGTYIVVSLIFLVSTVSLQVLMWLYWDRALQPRLQKEAASQANVLAHSQAVRLADALIVAQPDHRIGLLRETISEILLLTGPVAKEPLFLGLELEIDYEVIPASPDSLDLTGGTNQPEKSFVSEVALYSPLSDELMGIARFQVSDSLFQGLSNDVKNTLFTRSWIGTVLLIIVWGGVMILIRETNRSRQQAEMANRTKSIFLANMSHELRTPLNAIIGFSELMNRDQNFSAKQKENLSIINHSGNYLLDLINDAEFESQGAEVEWEQRIGQKFRWLANLSYTDAWHPAPGKDSDQRVGGIANWLGNLAFFLRPFPRYMVTGRLLYVGDRYTREGWLDRYEIVDFTVSRMDLLTKGLTLRLGVKNIFDDTVVYIDERRDGVRLNEYQGRTFWVQLSYDF